MNMKYQDVFRNRHVVLPVIHVSLESQALRNTGIAHEAGADGVFLINHGMHAGELLAIHHAVAGRFPGWWIGVNCLGLDPKEVFSRISQEVSGIWVDDGMIDERYEEQPAAEIALQHRMASGWRGLYFGGVAFKHQRPVRNVARAAEIAASYMDVVTTSGEITGKAPATDKIQAMKKSIGDFPLAIASGITPENVRDYLDSADCFLVATGISSSFTELAPARVKALIQEVRSYSSTGSTPDLIGG